MLLTVDEMTRGIGRRIRDRRLGLGWSQRNAAERAGVAYRTWRRMEADGKASIEDMVRATIAMRCEEGVSALFPPPAAATMDELMAQRQLPKKRMRAPATVKAG